MKIKMVEHPTSNRMHNNSFRNHKGDLCLFTFASEDILLAKHLRDDMTWARWRIVRVAAPCTASHTKIGGGIEWRAWRLMSTKMETHEPKKKHLQRTWLRCRQISSFIIGLNMDMLYILFFFFRNFGKCDWCISEAHVPFYLLTNLLELFEQIFVLIWFVKLYEYIWHIPR